MGQTSNTQLLAERFSKVIGEVSQNNLIQLRVR